MAARELPGGFYPLEEQPGVGLYRKDYRNGTPDFVLLVDLSTGASVDLLHGNPSENDGKKAGAQFAGPNPAFSQASIGGYWQDYSGSQPGAFCVLNGQFFYMPESPTPLALPLKTGGTVVTEGFGFPQYPEKQLMLALWPNRADILPLTQENLYGTDAPDVIGGLTPEANKKPKNAVGRTFIGIQDTNGDGIFETVLILATQTATQAEAEKTLLKLGAAKVMMLDGGGSTQLFCNGQAYIDTTRSLPQAIGVATAQGINSPDEGTGSQLAAPPASDLSAAAQAAISPASTPTDSAQSPAAPQGEQPPAEGEQPLPPPAETLAGGDPAGIDISGEAGKAVESNPESQPSAGIDSNLGENSPGMDNNQAAASLPGESTLSILTGPISGNGTQDQAGFIPPAAYLSSPSSAGQPGGFNPSDVLWLPAVISPLSIIILFAVRRRIRTNIWH